MNQKLTAFAEWIRGRRVALLGAGKSNLAAAEFLLPLGARTTVRDQNPPKDEERIRFFREMGMETRFGEGYLDGLCEELLLRSPSVRCDTPQIAAAVREGALLTSEIELFAALCPCKLFAVTGSDGKTTTTTLLSEMLTGGEAAVFTGGNIGTPLLPRVGEMKEEDICVLELSSFQLQAMAFSPASAVVTNVSPNHLNWHRDMAEYIDCKKNIYRGQTENCRLVLNYDNPITREMAKEARGEIFWFSSAGELPEGEKGAFLRDGTIFIRDGAEHYILDRGELLLRGRHNAENFMAAVAAAWGVAEPSQMQRTAREFRGVHHRLELVAKRGGVTYYNSSIDTSPTRTAAALSAFEERVILILGGYDKHIPAEPLIPVLMEKTKGIVLTGETGRGLLTLLKAAGYPEERMEYFEKFDDAVRYAMESAKGGDTVLLSPAAASFDAFPNFEKRGERFAALVKKDIK